MQTRRALADSRLPGLIRWEGPLRSPSSQGQGRRIIFNGYFDNGTTSSLGVRICIGMLKARPDLAGSLIDSQTLFSDASALFADVLHPNTADIIANMSDQAVFVSPKIVLLHTTKDKESWEATLIDLLWRDAERSIERVRWRASYHGGRTWVKPLALDNQVRAARTTAHAMTNVTTWLKLRSGPPLLSSAISSPLLCFRHRYGLGHPPLRRLVYFLYCYNSLSSLNEK